MPPVRTLVTPSAAKPQPATPTVTSQELQKPDAPKGVAGLALPDWAQPTGLDVPAELPGQTAVTYIGQLQDRSGCKAQALASGCQLGDFYLSDKGGVTPLRPFRFFLLTAAAFQSEMSATGDVVFATRDLTARRANTHEHYVTVVLADVNGTWFPAKADFRKAQQQVAAAAIGAVRAAADPDFPKQSDAHKIASVFPQPFGRVVTTVSIEKRVSKSSGQPYYACSGSVAPATLSEIESLAEAFKDPGFLELLDDAKKNFDDRVKMLASKCA